MHFHGMLTMLHTSYQQQPLQKEKMIVMIEEHLLCFRSKCFLGLGTNSSKFYSSLDSIQNICDDIEDWSPDLFNLFSYMGDKKRNTKKKKLIVS